MPELPEVETVRRGLAPSMEGAVLRELELRRNDLRFPFPTDFARHVSGRGITSLSRRAKYLLIDLENGKTIISHLGMSGSFRVEAGAAADTPGAFHHPRSKDEKHDHVVFHLTRSGSDARVIYNDPRRFGFMDIVGRADMAIHPFFRDLGPEPTGNELSADYLAKRFAGKAQPLKSALLDQKNIAGLGNIYVCEALWRSHLSPLRAAGTLVTDGGKPGEGLRTLVDAIREVRAAARNEGNGDERHVVCLPAWR